MKKKQLLSRAEMRNVLGGFAQNYTCTMTLSNGTTESFTVTAANGNAAQCNADAVCWTMDECTNVDCAGSGAC